MHDKLIDRMGRQFLALCKSGGRRDGKQKPVFHAVTPECRIALCGAEPGPRSSWAGPADVVTCPACLNRLARMLPANGAAGIATRRA